MDEEPLRRNATEKPHLFIFPIFYLCSTVYYAVLIFKSVDETLVCDHLLESYWAVDSRGTVYFTLTFNLGDAMVAFDHVRAIEYHFICKVGLYFSSMFPKYMQNEEKVKLWCLCNV